MSDEFMREKRRDLSGIGMSRRCFLHSAVVAVGVAGIAFGQDPINGLGDKPFIPDGTGTCDCVTDAAVPLTAVAMLGGKYYGFAGTSTGPRVYSLSVDRGREVKLDSPIKLGLPEGFVFGSLGVARGGLVVTGGLPFVVETIEVDYELTEDVRQAMDNSIPEGIPTTGRKQVDIMGVEPVVFMVGRGIAERVQLPEMPKRSFAVATAITESRNGGMAVMIEHSDGMNESFYASAIDVIEEAGRDWNIFSTARELGESGPNYLAADESGLIAGINSAEGSLLVRPSDGLARPGATTASERILALVPGYGGVTALTGDNTGKRFWSSVDSAGRLAWGVEATITKDDIVGAAAVSGTKGQVVMLGRRSALLVENIPYVSQVKGGIRNVM